MKKVYDFLFRLGVDPRWQYRAILAVGLPVSAYLFATGSIPLGEFLEAVAVLVIGPVAFHRVVKRLPGRVWIPPTVDGRLDQMSWRLRLKEHEQSEPDAKMYVGDFLDDPARLEVYLPPSFELVQSDDGSEVWRSDELRAVLRRDSLRIELIGAADEEAFAALLSTITQRRLLE